MSSTAAQSSIYGKFLTFFLAGEEYGIEISAVQEILRATTITPLPDSPPHILGVVNLRGVVVPILDMRARLGLAAADTQNEQAFVVVMDEDRRIALLVDQVSEVIEIGSSVVEPAPVFPGRTPNALVKGLAKSENRVRVLLELRTLLDITEPQLVD